MSEEQKTTNEIEFTTLKGLRPSSQDCRRGMAGGPGNMMLHHDRSNSND